MIPSTNSDGRPFTSELCNKSRYGSTMDHCFFLCHINCNLNSLFDLKHVEVMRYTELKFHCRIILWSKKSNKDIYRFLSCKIFICFKWPMKNRHIRPTSFYISIVAINLLFKLRDNFYSFTQIHRIHVTGTFY